MSSEANLSEKQAAPVIRRATPWWLTALKITGIVVCLLVAAAAYLYFFEMPSHSAPSRPPAKIADTSDKIIDSIHRGMDYIERHQESDGHFSKGWLDPKPAFTALVVDALARSPEKFREKDHPFLKKAAEAIISKQQPNGSLCTPVLSLDTYSTAMSVLALTALENPEYKPVIDKATKFLLDCQYKDDETSGPNAGGVGYTKGGKTSGDVSATWVESLKAAGVKEGDPAFKNAEKFFSRLQNDTELNKTPPINDKQIGSDGGFNYAPGESKCEEVRGGVHILWSYGLMSYQGLKSFMYMNIPKTDARIQSAFRWVRENYTLEENRNIGPDGLYYYYMTMAKALSLYGEPVITASDGAKHDWARELSEKIISLQDSEGAWHNTASSRWMENDKVMVTSFAIRALSICHDFLKEHPAK
ncbi:MAG TPA: prenyltransferase/squalene oxidase repeat-containing protein [Planctomycetota bacterium]|nr:prenyltransferase/squalene oxidase repeat-containing protein [Planctomycetota bacterium]